jgi:peptidoglycan/LPS O-acetylase OafA/YrhL
LVLIAVIPALHRQSGTAWDSKVPVTLGGVLSHLVLMHNLRLDWQGQVDGPMWSVATEWQLYFLLPLVLRSAATTLGRIMRVKFLPGYII